MIARRTTKRGGGFTLIEVLIAMLILGILTAIALPMYQSYVRHSRRSTAVTALLHAAALEEKYNAENNTYASSLTQLGYTASSIEVPNQQDDWYTMTVVSASTTGYTLNAAPTANGGQNKDECGSFTLVSTGQKTVSGSASAQTCWGGR